MTENSAQKIERAIAAENPDLYMFFAQGETSFVYGGYLTDGALEEIILALFDNVPETRSDLIAAANKILKPPMKEGRPPRQS